MTQSRARTHRPCMIIFIRNGAWSVPLGHPYRSPGAGAPPGTTVPRQEKPHSMTGPAFTAPTSRPDREDLTARAFRALDAGSGLHTLGGTHVLVPNGTPCFAGPSLGAIARQISAAPTPGPEPARRGQPRHPQSDPVP